MLAPDHCKFRLEGSLDRALLSSALDRAMRQHLQPLVSDKCEKEKTNFEVLARHDVLRSNLLRDSDGTVLQARPAEHDASKACICNHLHA